MKKIFSLLFLLATIALMAETFTLTPTDDMYTDVEHAGLPMHPTQLWTADFNPAGHFERIMIKFDLSQFHGYEITSATLHLTRLYSCPNGGTTLATFFPISQEWNENDWNHHVHVNYDATPSFPVSFIGPGGVTNHNFEVNVTGLIDYLVNGSTYDYGFLLKANRNQKFSKFYSKEYPNAACRPKLVIEANAVSSNDEVSKPVNQLTINNYPNPFNPSTIISFDLKQKNNISLDIYNILGKKITTLKKGVLAEGNHSYTWNGTDKNGNKCASGIYFYRLKTKSQSITKKMIMLK